MLHPQSECSLFGKIHFFTYSECYTYFYCIILFESFLSGEIMPIHLSFNNIRNSKAVSEHVHNVFEELIKITDDKYPFHVNLNKVSEESYHVGINCS